MSETSPTQPERAPIPPEYEALKPENLAKIDRSYPEDRWLDPTGMLAKQWEIDNAALTQPDKQPTSDTPSPESQEISKMQEPS